MKILNVKKEHCNVYEIPNNTSGTYFLLNNENEVVYVGKATCVNSRISQHKKNKNFSNVVIIETKNQNDAEVLERIYLNINLPLLNTICPRYNDIPLWALRDQIKELEHYVDTTVREMFIEIKNDLRNDYEKFIRIEAKRIFTDYQSNGQYIKSY